MYLQREEEREALIDPQDAGRLCVSIKQPFPIAWPIVSNIAKCMICLGADFLVKTGERLELPAQIHMGQSQGSTCKCRGQKGEGSVETFCAGTGISGSMHSAYTPGAGNGGFSFVEPSLQGAGEP